MYDDKRWLVLGAVLIFTVIGWLVADVVSGAAIVSADEAVPGHFVSVVGLPPDEIFEDVVDSVVNVRAWDDGAGISLGTGFVYETGRMLTAHHVIEGYEDRLFVWNSGYHEFVSVVGYDAEADIAVLALNGMVHPACQDVGELCGVVVLDPLRTRDGAVRHTDSAMFANGTVRSVDRYWMDPEDKVGVGEWVLSVGYESGLLTARSGMVASHEWETWGTTTLRTFVVDGYSGPGRSGAPVFNLWGEVVGMVLAGFDGDRLTVVVPIEMVMAKVDGWD